MLHRTSPEVHDGSGFREYQQGMYMFDSGMAFGACQTESQRRGWRTAAQVWVAKAPPWAKDPTPAEDESFEDWQDRMSIRNEPGYDYATIHGPRWA